MFTVPSSSTSILTPVASTMLRIILPPGPISSRILSVGIVQGEDARSVLREVLAGFGQHGDHLVEDEQAAAARLFERFLHDGGGDVRHLDVHLQGGDAFLGAGDLEVHVAVVIFGAGDVGEDGVVVAFLHQAHGDARHRSRNRHTGIHQRQGGAADRGHRARAVRLENVADHAEGVGESPFLRE